MSDSIVLDQPWQICRASLVALIGRIKFLTSMDMTCTSEMRVARETWGITAKTYANGLVQLASLLADIDADLANGEIHPRLQEVIDRVYG